MTLQSIRKLYNISREQIAVMNACSQMVIRRIENKPLKELTFGDIEMYTNAFIIDENDLISMLTGKALSSIELKTAFWEFNYNNTVNINKTYKALSGCSNKSSLISLYTYFKNSDKFKDIKLNWCYYKLIGEELDA